jgi:hypothetical protein
MRTTLIRWDCQARIRFALDDITWKRLREEHVPDIPNEALAHLSEDAAITVWRTRLQAAVNSLALKFHNIYGEPRAVYVLGGNAVRCHGLVTTANYMTPDLDEEDTQFEVLTGHPPHLHTHHCQSSIVNPFDCALYNEQCALIRRACEIGPRDNPRDR